MKYFLHYTDTMQDEKIAELFINFGYTGTGLFFAILENIAHNECPVSEKILLYQLKIKGKKLIKIYDFLFQIELLLKQKDKIFNENVLKVAEKYKIKKQKTKKRVAEWRENQKDNGNVTRYEHVSNAYVTPVNKSKVNKSKDNKENKENKLHLFKNSKYFDIKILKSELDKKYLKYDIDYYYQSMLDYSESKSKKYNNWLATCRSWINRDIKNNDAKLKLNNTKKVRNLWTA